MKTFEQIAGELLKIPEADIRNELRPEDIPEWDSMNYLLFIAALEREYSISFTMDEVLSSKSLGDVHALVNAKKPA